MSPALLISVSAFCPSAYPALPFPLRQYAPLGRSSGFERRLPLPSQPKRQWQECVFSHYGGGPARAFHPFPYSSESVHDNAFRHPTAVFQQILAYYTTFVLI